MPTLTKGFLVKAKDDSSIIRTPEADTDTRVVIEIFGLGIGQYQGAIFGLINSGE